MVRIAQSADALFQGQAALDCSHGHPDGRPLLLSSSLVEALDIWAGVFSAPTGEGQERRTRATTALCLFRMSEIQARAKSCSWDFETQQNCVSPAPGSPRERCCLEPSRRLGRANERVGKHPGDVYRVASSPRHRPSETSV
ncbi:Plexin-C1 [Heterocephalus glaber]|uniref:Plexin-C1 n=1 Tax=Heterocephalus glaber TaxID=10181 RepID=G5C0U4_HETGA|nr:Plexin-C1 [Heterocephalus glaber]